MSRHGIGHLNVSNASEAGNLVVVEPSLNNLSKQHRVLSTHLSLTISSSGISKTASYVSPSKVKDLAVF